MLININQKKNFNFYLFSISYRALKKPVRVVCVSGGCVWFDTSAFKLGIVFSKKHILIFYLRFFN